MTIGRVRADYGAKAREYIDAVGRIEDAAEVDREFIGEWAHSVEGPILDVGCGPGQWTHWLSNQGVSVAGIDPVPEFIKEARSDYPEVKFEIGEARSLSVADGSLGGVLAWYSLIHSNKSAIEAVIREFARAIKPKGSLLLGFFSGDTHKLFGHAVTTAYYWPVDLVTAEVEEAGFDVIHSATRADPGVRRHGELIAIRR